MNEIIEAVLYLKWHLLGIVGTVTAVCLVTGHLERRARKRRQDHDINWFVDPGIEGDDGIGWACTCGVWGMGIDTTEPANHLRAVYIEAMLRERVGGW